MPGRQIADCAGLLVEAEPTGSKGIYFTDETIEVNFKLKNLLNKRLIGEVTFFYGFGPSGLEAKTHETIEFDLQANGEDNINAMQRLVGFQGNGVIGMVLPRFSEKDAIKTDTDTERTIKLPRPSPIVGESPVFHTLYTFTSMEREFYQRFYERPEVLMGKTKDLTKQVRTLTCIVIVLAGLTVAITLLQAFGVLPPMEVKLSP